MDAEHKLQHMPKDQLSVKDSHLYCNDELEQLVKRREQVLNLRCLVAVWNGLAGRSRQIVYRIDTVET